MEIIEFSWMGLRLQEPMALVTNWLIAAFAFYAYFDLRFSQNGFTQLFSRFFLFLGISTFCGGLGHIFFQYLGIYGKFPAWTFGVMAGYFSISAMVSLFNKEKYALHWRRWILLSSFSVIVCAVAFQSFLFVTVDAVVKYLTMGGLAFFLSFKRALPLHWVWIGVIILIPSVFIFLFQINVSTWLNKDDLSHVLMLGSIICFHASVKNYESFALYEA